MVRAGKRRYRIQTRRLIFAALFVLFVVTGITAGANLIIGKIGYAAAQSEYDDLRQYAPVVLAVDAAPHSNTSDSTAPSATPEPPPDLSAINPDYIGWIRIDGTDSGRLPDIDYPVVQGTDNKKYLDTTFADEKNAAGTIFMDAECADGFDSPLAILYGHNMKDGSMFAGLNRYLEDGYLADHPAITISTSEDEILIYRIFAVRVTDIWDEVFSLYHKSQTDIAEYLSKYDAPEDAVRFIMLSTCTTDGNDNERLLVFGALER
jgi:sortase B